MARRRPPAGDGWRKAVTKMTFGRVNPEPSAKREQTDELIQRICAPLADVHKLAFVSAKGGVGKTTMTVLVGNAVARLRGDRVMAVDVDADLGDLSARFSERGGPQTNIEHFVSSQHTKRYADVRVHTVMNKDRLEMLGAQNDPRSTYKFGPEDYGAAMQILETHCNVILLDCGTPVNGPLFSNILNDVTGLVVVASEDVRGVEERWSLWTGWGAWLWPVASAHCGCSQRNPENPVTCGLRGRRKPVQEARSGFLSDSLRPASGHGFGGRFQLSQAKDTQRRAGFGRRPGTALSG